MTTINLYQGRGESANKNASIANGGFWLSLSILLLTILGYFGLRMYVQNIVKQNEQLGQDIISENQSLAGVDSLQRVLDMQSRVAEINKNLEIKNGEVGKLKVTEIMDNLQSDMNSGIYISQYDFDSELNEIKLTIESSNFNDSARQILNLKKSPYFSDVNLIDLTRADDVIKTQLEMKIKGTVK